MCTRPLTAFQNPTGGRPLFGWQAEIDGLNEIKLPCGRCPECCKDYYTQWATRGSRELANWDSNLFITLTYDEDHLPENRSLNKKHVQDFIKRVKTTFCSNKENPIRQTYCGEYGSRTLRPHYHVVLYNCDFADKKFHRRTDQGHAVYTSELLSDLWRKGHAEFGYATPASIAYLYKYILKKKTRKEKKKPLIIETDGLTWCVDHEFIESSRNPGIGAFLRGSSTLRKGYLTVNGQKKPLPKYYLEWLRVNEPDVYDDIKNLRFDFAQTKPKETVLRREQKEKAQKKLTDSKKRM